MRPVIITDTVSNLGNVYRTLTQQAGCLFHTQVTKELSARDTRDLLHPAVQLGPADADITG